MNISRIKFLTISVVVLTIAGIGLGVFWKRGNSPAPDSSVGERGNEKGEKGTIGTFTDSTNSGSLSRPRLSQTYSNAELGFSFNYPEGFNVSGFAEGEVGYTILAQKPGSRDNFQIFVSDFDEPGPITSERIRQDVPDMVMEDPQTVLIGQKSEIRNPKSETNSNDQNSKSQNGIPALIFFGQHPSLGRTREVWFVWNGKLYQLTTYAELDNLIGPVLETLRFQ